MKLKEILKSSKKTTQQLYNERKRVKDLFITEVGEVLKQYFEENNFQIDIDTFSSCISKTDLKKEDFYGYDSDSIIVVIDKEFDFYYAKRDVIESHSGYKIDLVRIGDYFKLEDVYPRRISKLAEILLDRIKRNEDKKEIEIQKLSQITGF